MLWFKRWHISYFSCQWLWISLFVCYECKRNGLLFSNCYAFLYCLALFEWAWMANVFAIIDFLTLQWGTLKRQQEYLVAKIGASFKKQVLLCLVNNHSRNFPNISSYWWMLPFIFSMSVDADLTCVRDFDIVFHRAIILCFAFSWISESAHRQSQTLI